MLDRVPTHDTFAVELIRSAEARIAELKSISGCTEDLPVRIDKVDFSVSANPELKAKLTTTPALKPVAGRSREDAETIVSQQYFDLARGDWLPRHVRAPGTSRLPGSFEADFDATCGTCSGHKKIGCRTCSSSGEVTCGACSNGTVRCSCGYGKEKCITCHGSGKVGARPEPVGFYDEPKQTMDYRYHCTACAGSGRTGCCRYCKGDVRQTCRQCGGSSMVTCSTCHGSKRVGCGDCGAHGIRAYTLSADLDVAEKPTFTGEGAHALRDAVQRESAASRQYDELQRHDLVFETDGGKGQYSFSGRFHRASVIKDKKLLLYFDHPDEAPCASEALFDLLTKKVRSQLASKNYGALGKSPLGQDVLALVSDPSAGASSRLQRFDPSGSLIKAARDVGYGLSDEITKGRLFRKSVPVVVPAILVAFFAMTDAPSRISSSEFARRFGEQTRFELIEFIALMSLFVLPSLLCLHYYFRERVIIKARTPRGVTVSGDTRKTGFKKLFLISAVALPATPFILNFIALRF